MSKMRQKRDSVVDTKKQSQKTGIKMNTKPVPEDNKKYDLSPIEEEHKKLARVILKLANKFKLKYGGSIDDWISEINFVFLVAYKTFSSNKNASMSTWLYILAEKRAISYLKTMIKNKKMYSDLNKDQKKYSYSERKPELFITEDAKTVLRILNENASEFINKLKKYTENKSISLNKKRALINRMLLNKLIENGPAWNQIRLNKCLAEIQEMVSE